MSLLLMGINHTTANVALREKVAFPPETVSLALAQLLKQEAIAEAVIVSTCNRTEIYLETETTEIQETEAVPCAPATSKACTETMTGIHLTGIHQQLLQWMSHFHQLDVQELQASSYFYDGEAVVRQLMKVSCGLDSMVLGEPQIFGQIKSAFAMSKDADAIKGSLGRVFQTAFTIAKEVRTDTAIGQSPVSVAYAAAGLSERIFSDLSKINVLLIGAGKTIELVAQHLKERGVNHITVANRTLDNALELAGKIDGKGILLSDIPEQLLATDMVVSSTNSQLPLLGKGAVENALKQRRHKAMLLVDLAVPRDIEPEVGDIADAYLYSVDDIGEVIDDGVKSRAEAAIQAEDIIDRGVARYQKQIRALNAVDTLKALRHKAEAVRSTELERALKALEKGDTPDQVLEALARGITNKLIHSPSVQMKKASAQGNDELLALTQQLFDLDID